MGRKWNLLCERRGDVTVVSFVRTKILDELIIKEIRDELTDLVDKHGKDKILINFENVEFLSSRVLGVLIDLGRKLKDKNGRLRLCEIAPPIYEIFKIMNLHKKYDLWEILESEEDALAAPWWQKG